MQEGKLNPNEGKLKALQAAMAKIEKDFGLSRKAVLYYSKYNHFDDKYPDTNMITQMLLLDFKVVEIPAVMHARTSGKSMHSGLKPIWYMMRMSRFHHRQAL